MTKVAVVRLNVQVAFHFVEHIPSRTHRHHPKRETKGRWSYSLEGSHNKNYSSAMKDLPHHVPIRKENRWDAIQHYASAPNTAVAAIPIRRPVDPDLLMPERQESVASYTSQYSSHARQRYSNRSLTSMSREDGDDDSTATPFSPMQQRRWHRGIKVVGQHRNTVSSILSSPSSQNSRYSSKQPISSRSLLSSSPLATTFEERKHNREPSYRNYRSSLSDLMINHPTTRPYTVANHDPGISRADDWFQHSDDSSLSQEEDSADKPYSGRSNNSATDSKHRTDDNHAASETSIFALSEASPEIDAPPSRTSTRTGNIITEESVKRVLRESAPHSRIDSSDQSTVSDTNSTKLDRLREKMKRLREKNHQQLLESRSQLQRTRSSSQKQHVASAEIVDSSMRPSLNRNKSFLISPATSKQSFSQPTGVSNGVSVTSSKFRDPSLQRTQSVSQSTNSSTPKPMKMIPKPVHTDWRSQNLSHVPDSDSWSLNSNEDDMEGFESFENSSRKDFTTKISPRRSPRSFVPRSSLSSTCTAIAEEEEEDEEEVEEKEEETVEPEIEYDPAFDPDLDINSSFDSSKSREQVTDDDLDAPAFDPDFDVNPSFDSSKSREQVTDNELDEDLFINSSFESSKCSSIAEEVVKSLRAERLSMNTSFNTAKHSFVPEEEVRTERKYDSGIHITRQYSVGRSAKDVSSPTSSPTRSKLQKKLERRGRRSKPTRSPTAQQEKQDITPEAKNLAQELREALSARGPPVQAEEEQNHPWCDPVQSDGVIPLASEDSLSPPALTLPTSFQEKRRAYLKSIGDSEESRRQSPFTTANWVLGKLPEKPPIHDCSSQVTEEKEEAEYTETKTYRERPRKRNSRKNIRKNTSDVYPARDSKKSQKKSPKKLTKDDGSKNNGRRTRSRREPPLHESTKSGSKKQNWAQNSFVSPVKPSPTKPKGTQDNKPRSTRRLTRGESTREKEEDINSNAPSRRLATKERNERDENPRKPSSRKLLREASESSIDEDWEETSKEASIRSLVKSKASKEKEEENNASFRRRQARRNSKQSSLDQPGERNSSELSRRLLGVDNKALMDEDRDDVHRKSSSKGLVRDKSKPSIKKGRGASSKSTSKKTFRNNSKTSVDQKPQSSSRKVLRSPSQTPEKRRDRTYKKHSEMDITTRVSNATTSPQKPLSWRVTKEESESKNESEIAPEKTSSGRYGSRLRNSSNDNSSNKPSSGRFGKSVRKKEDTTTEYPSAGGFAKLSAENQEEKKPKRSSFGSIVSKFSIDKREEKKPKRNSFGSIVSKFSKDKEGEKKTKRSSFGSIVNKFSIDKEDEKQTKRGSYNLLNDSSMEDLEDSPTSQNFSSATTFEKTYQFRSSPSRGSLTRQPSSRNLIFSETSIDKRDDSNRSISKKPKRPSSWRDDANHSLTSHSGTLVTVESDPSSNDSGSESHPEEIVAKHDAKNVSKNDDLNTSKHGRRTRPRRNNSHRSAMRRLRRYKDYRKNGVLVAEEKRFHIDMTGGIQ